MIDYCPTAGWSANVTQKSTLRSFPNGVLRASVRWLERLPQYGTEGSGRTFTAYFQTAQEKKNNKVSDHAHMHKPRNNTENWKVLTADEQLAEEQLRKTHCDALPERQRLASLASP